MICGDGQVMKTIPKLLQPGNTAQTKRVGRDTWKELEGLSHFSLFQGRRGLGQILLPIEDMVMSLEDSSSQAGVHNPRCCFQILCEKKNKDTVYVRAGMPVVLSQVRMCFILELCSYFGMSACVLDVHASVVA